MNRALLAIPGLLLLALAAPAPAQDPVKVDAKHYKVEFENSEVRVLRITYGAHEKSVMHSHPDAVAVFLTDGSVRFHTPDGKSVDMTPKAGDSRWTPAGPHLPENTGEKPFEVVLVELKHHAAKAAKPAKKK